MDLTELRTEIDAIDRELIALLERRMDVAAGIASYKQERGLPVLDGAREAEKLDAVRVQCRPETAENIADIFKAVMAASRAHQKRLMEGGHGG